MEVRAALAIEVSIKIHTETKNQKFETLIFVNMRTKYKSVKKEIENIALLTPCKSIYINEFPELKESAKIVRDLPD